MALRQALSLPPTRIFLSSHCAGRRFAYPVKPYLNVRPSRSSSSSTSALAYKSLHRRSPLPLPVADSPTWSAPAAVSSILYETPVPSSKPPERHVLNCLVQNEPGVLSRISGILAARGFNIDSLVVCNTEVEDLSRMTIVLHGLDGVVEQARRQLDDLVPVWAVLDYTDSALVQRELLLAKVSILGPEVFEELLQHHREITTPENEGAVSGSCEQQPQSNESKQGKSKENRHATDYHPSRLAQSQALRHKHEHLEAITHLTHQFGGKVLDISTNNCIVELSAKPSRIDSFLKLISPFGILESTRTGLMALPRSPLTGPDDDLEKDATEVVDASTLPPG
ncbi:acetolactate synthase, small subunit [Paracoccidioides brasiliensis Pb03]|uniref:Acetolactate synthase, small subunit n=2 Tax=Paracoccidioides brasiliensis TaxID=121759 RepID=C1GLR3_PARBD|nr:acetolactate synthase, small subunit [Paracoccidioides brasiliensis Pb18]EEH18508.1 acetolactate synthase, small subunit [Paracoccidioides brasiliensis Pb03]EEH43379.1 acetolactate synthase, small subunit [Paracoccidioides brasiliensis Pb18]ODH20149.1 acetolactate synthase, small subunit [Paracoccidioides brasiliensis]ODH46481.1 acetolactate synthase, small subunit [Paracoccidioides brasiliensis]